MSKKDTKFKKEKLLNEEVKVFKQFEKHKLIHRIGFVAAALIVAVWVNTIVLNGDFWNQLKTNVLESSAPVEEKADVYLESVEWADSSVMSIRAGKKMDAVETLSLWITYNPEQVELLDVFSNIVWLDLARIENTPWSATLIMTFSEVQDIQKWKDIVNFYLSKKENHTQHINIANANFTDETSTNYQLTTSWMTF